MVSGTLKDRIAKFNNPSAAPLLPTHPFGTAGPGQSGAGAGKKGLYGNRIPSLDPKSAGHVPLPGRKVSENRGLIGNRIPSSVSGNIAGLAASNTGGSTGASQSATKTSGAPRPTSPTGSVDSSTLSAPADSGSPATSRSSSPPTSPGGGLPPSLLAATLPDLGGPGAMTPSSTRADAGEEEASDRSAPSTPVVGATIQLPPAEYDLVPGNLKLADAAQMSRGLSASSNNPRNVARSVTSSLASQYDPSSQGNEEEQMKRDVSGISTPTGTPKAAHRELEGSTRGEGSVTDDGSVRGDDDREMGDMENVSQRLQSLALRHSTDGEDPETNKREEGMEVDDVPTPSGDIADPMEESLSAQPDKSTSNETTASDADADRETGSKLKSKPVQSEEPKKKKDLLDEDPNKASDLDALKRGELSTSPPPSAGADPLSSAVDSLVQSGFEQNLDEQIPPTKELKEQGGHAGTRFIDVEKPDEVIEPSEAGEGSESAKEVGVKDADAEDDKKQDTRSTHGGEVEHKGAKVDGKEDESDDPKHKREESNITQSKEEKEEQEPDKELGPEMVVRAATPEQDADENPNTTAKAKVLRRKNIAGPNEPTQIDIKPAAESGTSESGDKSPQGMRAPGGIQADLDDPAKNDFVNEAFSGDLEAYAEPDDEAKEGELGTLAEPSHVEHVGAGDVSALEKVGVGQSAVAEAKAAKVTADNAEGNNLEYAGATEEDDEELGLDKREGKTYKGELHKMEQEDKGAEVVRPSITKRDSNIPHAVMGKKVTQGDDLGPLHFETADGKSVMPEGDITRLPLKGKEEDENEKKEEEGMMQLPTSDGPTIQVPKKMDDDDVGEGSHASAQDSSAQGPQGEKEGEHSAGESELQTKSEEPILTQREDTRNPLQVNIEPAPIAQPVKDSSPSSSQIPNPTSSVSEDRQPTPTPPNFPEPPHSDPSTEAPQSAKSISSDRSSTPIDPAIMRSFPDVPDEEHPRVEIHVSPHVTPAKSGSSSKPLGKPDSPTKSSTQQSVERKDSLEAPTTPETAQGEKLDVNDPSGTGSAGGAGLSKRRSVRRSPKSPLLGDEDPGDYVPGEEGWAVVTK